MSSWIGTPDVMNLEKQIKRHVIGRRHHYFAITTPGLEALCARELEGLSDTLHLESVAPGGVSFSGRLDDLYRANLHLRTAGRVLLRIDEFKATNFRQLEKKTASTAWSWYLPAGALPVCKASARRSRLYHSQAVAQAVEAGLSSYWQRNGLVPHADKEQTLYVRLDQDSVRISLDASGANLHRRGFKTHAAAAPLRETLAAAVLLLAGYDPQRPLLDPMCGSGTFALEAALICKQIAPGLKRDFAFAQWPSFRNARWQHLKNAAVQKVQQLQHPLIHASDNDPEATRLLAECVERNHFSDAVSVRRADFFALCAPAGGKAGLIVLNPPYGLRLAPDRHPRHFYRRIAAKLARDFKGWQVAWIVPRTDWTGAAPVGLKPLHIRSGGLPLMLLVGKI